MKESSACKSLLCIQLKKIYGVSQGKARFWQWHSELLHPLSWVAPIFMCFILKTSVKKEQRFGFFWLLQASGNLSYCGLCYSRGRRTSFADYNAHNFSILFEVLISNIFLTVVWNKQWHYPWSVYSISWFRWWVLASGGKWEQDVSLCHFSSCTLLENLVLPVSIPKVREITPLYFQIISMNPKFSPNSRETKNKALEVPCYSYGTYQTHCPQYLWRQRIFKTSTPPKGQYRHSQFHIMLCDCLWFRLAGESLHCSHKQHTTRQKLSCWWFLVTKFWQH